MVNTRMVYIMVKERTLILMETYLKENGRRGKDIKERTLILMETYMKEIGRKGKDMVMEHTLSLKGISM